MPIQPDMKTSAPSSLAGGYAVTATSAGGIEARFVDVDAERAYARAVLARLGAAQP